MKIALGQFNSVVGDFAGNAQKIREFYTRAVREDVDLLIFPELAVCGYPPEDLVLKKHFIKECSATVEKIAADCPEKTIIIGYVGNTERENYNSAAVLRGGKISNIYRKVRLPNYGVFDEHRVFQPGGEPVVINIDGINVAVTICADIWNIEWLGDFLKDSGSIQLTVNISASPFHYGKIKIREEIVRQCAKKLNSAVAYCNLVGGQDE
ncbi:MAG: hypothetical protein JW715_13215, partial [Sedimentisphaerales bacterium]|nr:hypothetical protein [Sedimentisphaerales bacterium]